MHGATQAFDDSDAVLLRESKVAAHDAGRVHAWVKSILEGSKAAEKAYAFKHRLKPFDEIFAKVRAKRNHEDPALRKPGYGVADLTDISGFRIVSLFNAEIPVALGRLLDLLKTPIPAGSPGAFLPVPVKELIVFSSRREGDPLSIEAAVRTVVQEHGLELPPPSVASYSSVHVIIQSRVAIPDEAPLIAASEIQLRSVFEEAWSEVNHRLKYAPAKRERARGGIAADVAGEEAAVLQHLDALKSLTDGCGQYADLINLDLTSRRERRGDRLPQPTESAEALLRSFRGCSPDVYGKVKQAFELRTEATAAARSVSENPVGAPTRDKQAVLPRRPSLRGGIRSNSVRGARYTAAREPRGHPPSRNGVLLLVLRQQRAAASS
jgi:ppGpp synthetase/RelA/SpoT-type nucleotidyltranferase